MTSESKNSSDEEKAKLLVCLIEQNWLHARHVENERLWFTNIYLLVVAGVLAYLGSMEASLLDITFRVLIAFLLIFSALGLLATAKLSAEFGNCIERVGKIFDERAEELKDYVGIPLDVGPWKYIKVRRVFISFYGIMVILWLLILVLPLMSN